MAAWSDHDSPVMPTMGWGPIKPTDPPKRTTPAVRLGRRRSGRAHGVHIFNLPVEQRHMAHELSRVGRRPQDRI